MADRNMFYITKTAIIVALGGFLMGFDASVISGVIGYIESEFQLTKIELGWAVSSLTLTSTLAMLASGPLSDKIGRKKVLSIAAFLFAVSAILSAIAPTFTFLVVARMIGGFGVGAALIIAPVYIAEISPGDIRGRMVSFNQLNIVLGILIAFLSNYLIQSYSQSDASWVDGMGLRDGAWRWMLGIETLPAVVYFFALFLVPRSPRWLLMNDMEDEARKVLVLANGQDQAEQEINAARESIARAAEESKSSVMDLFKPAMRFVILIGVTIGILQQITGINSVFFYAPRIFEQSGIGTNAAFSQAIYIGIINIVFTLLAMSLIDRLGRKPLLAIGLAGITLSMFLLAYGFNQATYTLTPSAIEGLPAEVDRTAIGQLAGQTFDSDLAYKAALRDTLGERAAIDFESNLIEAAATMNAVLILIGILGFVASFGISLGPVMWVLFSELFPNKIRGIAISFVGVINSTVSFLVQLIFPWELANLGNAATFLIYGLFALIGIFIVIMIVPETKGKTLEELEKDLVK